MIKTYVQSMGVPFICMTFKTNLTSLNQFLHFYGNRVLLDGIINKMGFSAVHGK